MNRQQALILSNGMNYYAEDGTMIQEADDATSVIDEIYDDFESRTCGNCFFGSDKYYCDNPNSFCEATRIEPTDGCNQFERAE